MSGINGGLYQFWHGLIKQPNRRLKKFKIVLLVAGVGALSTACAPLFYGTETNMMLSAKWNG